MIESICSELELQRSYLNHDKIDTIYFGGGTPSILASTEIENILTSIHTLFEINSYPEITMEANPDDLSMEKLKGLKKLGINRLSIGIQSFHDKILKYLNRAHNSKEAIFCIKNAREAGFENLSIDLIFSIPDQTIGQLKKDMDQAFALNPEHISVYSLTIEEKTVFGNWYKKRKIRQLSDEDSANQFDFIITTLEDHGYEQYEISNFCRDERYSRHNTSYWKNIKYLGIGPGAHSYNSDNRQFNVANNHKYMKSIREGIVPSEGEKLTKMDRANEFILTSLRTKWGCDLLKLHDLFGYNLIILQENKIKELISEAQLFMENKHIFLTRKGKFLADTIIADLFWI